MFRRSGLPKGTLEVDDWRVWVTQGRHEKRDRRIWVKAPGASEPDLASIPAVAAIVRSLFLNEDVIRGPERGMKGGEYLLEFLVDVCLWKKAAPIQTMCQRYKMPTPRILWVPTTANGAPTDEPPLPGPFDTDDGASSGDGS
jgi:hypothetical protein